jgi:hypothetical protein
MIMRGLLKSERNGVLGIGLETVSQDGLRPRANLARALLGEISQFEWTGVDRWNEANTPSKVTQTSLIP